MEDPATESISSEPRNGGATLILPAGTRLGRRDEAVDAALRALRVAQADRKREPWVRAHFDLVLARAEKAAAAAHDSADGETLRAELGEVAAATLTKGTLLSKLDLSAE